MTVCVCSVAEKKVQKRVQITVDKGLDPPRLEQLATRLGLDAFEKKIIWLLVGKPYSCYLSSAWMRVE